LFPDEDNRLVELSLRNVGIGIHELNKPSTRWVKWSGGELGLHFGWINERLRIAQNVKSSVLLEANINWSSEGVAFELYAKSI